MGNVAWNNFADPERFESALPPDVLALVREARAGRGPALRWLIEGPGRIYVVEPTGPFVDDPNLTDKKFPGNPTKSYRSRDPLRVVAEHLGWQGHSPEEIQAMKDGIAGLQPVDD